MSPSTEVSVEEVKALVGGKVDAKWEFILAGERLLHRAPDGSWWEYPRTPPTQGDLEGL